MEKHSIDLWPNADHSQPPRRYWLNIPAEAWPNEPEPVEMSPQAIIKRLTLEYQKTLAENCLLVKERDRLRQAYIFRHFEYALAVGFPVACVLAIWLKGLLGV